MPPALDGGSGVGGNGGTVLTVRMLQFFRDNNVQIQTLALHFKNLFIVWSKKTLGSLFTTKKE